MIEILQIEFGFDSSIGPDELRSMLTELQQQAHDPVDDESASVLYMGEETDFLPENISPSEALNAILNHNRGALQLQSDGFHYLIHINPSDGGLVSERCESTGRIMISIDGVYFERDGSINLENLAEIISSVCEYISPDIIVGFGIDTGPGDPTPQIEWYENPAGRSAPVHWLTFIPDSMTGIQTPDKIYQSYGINGGKVYILTDDPCAFDEIKSYQRDIIAAFE